MFLLVLAALAAPAEVDGVPLEVAQAMFQIEILRLPSTALKGWVADPDPDVRRRVALAIGRLRDEDRGADLLVPLSMDADIAVRAEAAFALGQTPGTARLLRDRWRTETDANVLAILAVALGKQGGAEAVDLLVAGLEGPAAVAAAEGLGRLAMRKVEGAATVGVANALLAQIGGPLAPARQRSAWALGRLGLATAPEDLVRRLGQVALTDSDALVRAWGLRAWSGVATGEVRRPILLATSRDPSAGVRIASARAVAKACPDSPTEILLPLAGDGDPNVVLESLAAVGACGGDLAPTVLVPFLTGGNPLLAAAAIRGLVAADALPAPVERYTEPDQPMLVRVAAAESIKNPDRLLSLALNATEAPVRSAAAGALLAAEAPRVPDILALIASPDPIIAVAAADKIKDKPDPTAEKPLVDRLAVGDLGLPEATTLLRALAAVYATGTIAKPVPGAAKVLKPFLTLPGLGADVTRITAVLGIAIPAADHPHRRIPLLEEVLAVRSARIFTSEGEIRVSLASADAPYTVWNFASLADQGYFNGVLFHRVVPDFVIQSGDPRGDGWGGPGWEIPDEINRLPYTEGALGMALSGPDTGGSQWFITLSPQPHLEGTYTVFGAVTYGQRTAWAVSQGARIEKIVIERVPWGPG